MLALTQSITFWQSTGNGGDGETYGTGATVDARWVERHKIIKNKHGSDVISTHRIYCDTDIEYGSYIFLGDFLGDLNIVSPDALQIISKHTNPSAINLLYYEV